MSQSTNHSSPSSSSDEYQTTDSSYLVETNIYELSCMMMQPNMVRIDQHIFAKAQTLLTYMCYYQHPFLKPSVIFDWT